jgi:hypothetical protein
MRSDDCDSAFGGLCVIIIVLALAMILIAVGSSNQSTIERPATEVRDATSNLPVQKESQWFDKVGHDPQGKLF